MTPSRLRQALHVAAASGALALAPAACAEAAGLKVTASPGSGGTPAKQKPLTVDFSVTLGDALTPRSITMLLPGGLQVNTPLFPSCTAARLQARGPAGCPSGSRVGTGSALGKAVGVDAKLKIDVFNGPGLGQLLMLIRGSTPITVNSVVQSKAVEGDAISPVGLRFDMPANLIEPLPGLKSSLPQFRVKVGKTITLGGQKVGYLARVGCPTGRSRWAARIERDDAAPQLLTTSVRCR